MENTKELVKNTYYTSRIVEGEQEEMKWKFKNFLKEKKEYSNEKFEMENQNEKMRQEYERRRKEILVNNEDKWYDKKNEQLEEAIREALKRKKMDID